MRKEEPDKVVKVASWMVVDVSGSEISICTFGEEVVDHFVPLLTEGFVVIIYGGKIRRRNRNNYSHPEKDIEIVLTSTSKVIPSIDSGEIKTKPHKFTCISDCERFPDSTFSKGKVGITLSIIGIVRTIGEVKRFTSKTTNKSITKRTLCLSDASGRSVKNKSSTPFFFFFVWVSYICVFFFFFLLFWIFG